MAPAYLRGEIEQPWFMSRIVRGLFVPGTLTLLLSWYAKVRELHPSQVCFRHGGEPLS